MKFKILYNEEVRRFTLEKSPSWVEFWKLLSDEIFSKKQDFHPELYLQYTDNEGDLITVSTSKEYEEMLNSFSANDLIKISIIEGKGGYFKDGPPPIPIALYQQIDKISGLYSTFIQSENSTWAAWKPLSISNSHDLVTLSDFTLISPEFTSSSLSWTGEDQFSDFIIENNNERKNNTSGNFEFDREGTSFEGWILFHSHFPFASDPVLLNFSPNLKVQIKGVRVKNVEEENLNREGYGERVKDRVPQFLASLFKGGKILPNHIPDWLSSAITVKPLLSDSHNVYVDDENPFGEGNDPIVDLDIDLNKLYLAVHEKALELLDQKEFAKAEEYFFVALELNPTSTVAHYNLACVYSLSGNFPSAIQYLQKAINLGYSNLSHILSDSDLFPLHHYPEFSILTESLAHSLN